MSVKYIIAFFLVLFAISTMPVHSQPEPVDGSEVPSAVESDGSYLSVVRRGGIATVLVDVQQRMNASLRDLMATVRSGGTEVWMILVVLGLFYGVIHSILPGHRKMLLFSYFLAQPAPIRHGVIAGVALGALHAITSMVVVLVGYFLLQLSLSATVEQATATISRITAVFIVLLGGALLFTHARELFGHNDNHNHGADHGHDHGGGHSHNHSDGHIHDRGDNSWFASFVGKRGFLTALIVSGIVPCPGATMVLLLAVALGAVHAGLVVVVSMSVGMALTLSVLAVLTILFKSRMNRLLKSERGHLLHIVFETGAAGFILVFGLVLLTVGPI